MAMISFQSNRPYSMPATQRFSGTNRPAVAPRFGWADPPKPDNAELPTRRVLSRLLDRLSGQQDKPDAPTKETIQTADQAGEAPPADTVAQLLCSPTGGADHKAKHTVAGLEMSVAQLQGLRPYQEDRYGFSVLEPRSAAEYPQSLKDAYAETAAKTNGHGKSGSTSTTGVLTADNKLIVAYIGDSPIYHVLKNKATGEVAMKLLTPPHAPEDPAEKARVEAAGGRIHFFPTQGTYVLSANGRHGIAMTRCFGDNQIVGASREPDIVELDLNQYPPEQYEQSLLLASDGAFETSDLEGKAANLLKHEQTDAQKIAQNAYDNYSEDNITCLHVKLPDHQIKRNKDFLFTLADGHGGSETSTEVVPTLIKALAKDD